MNNKKLAESLKIVLNLSKFNTNCGDRNLCYIENRDNEVTRMLEQNGFAQLVHAASHFKVGHFDHVYSNHKPCGDQAVQSIWQMIMTLST